MPINYDDIIDFQYNPFTQTYAPYWVGWAGHPTGKERPAEDHVVPSDGYLQLYGTPQENIPSTTRCFIGLFELQEVASNITPAYDQFAVWYDELGLGWVRMNPGRLGQTASVWYYDLGTIIQKDTLDSRVPSSGNTSIAGVKTFSDTTQSTTKDNGAVVIEGGLGVEKNLNVGGDANITGTVTAGEFSGDTTGNQIVTYYDSSLVESTKVIKKAVVEIGAWNLAQGYPSQLKTIDLSTKIPDSSVILDIKVSIRFDSGTTMIDMTRGIDATSLGVVSVRQTRNSSNQIVIILSTVAATVTDIGSTNLDGTSANRGWIIIEYFEP